MPIASADLTGAVNTLIGNTETSDANIKNEWAELAKAFFMNVTMPIFTDHSAGQSAFKAALVDDPTGGAAGPSLAAAFEAYAKTAAAGAAGTPKMTPIVPPSGLTLSGTLALSVDGADAATFASTLVGELKTWAALGTYTVDNTIPAPIVLTWT